MSRPEPSWWAGARKLHKADPAKWTNGALAAYYNVSPSAVSRALKPEVRKKNKQAARDWRAANPDAVKAHNAKGTAKRQAARGGQ